MLKSDCSVSVLALFSGALGLLFPCAEWVWHRRVLAHPDSPVAPSAQVMSELLGRQTLLRRVLLLLGGLMFLAGARIPGLLPLALLLAFASFVIERHQFFTASFGPRMTEH
ncbi:MAG: hypothetical protein AAF514_00145 [Verrucomicrobiota bacterium]